ncbi:uncharacterized protein BDR25DRAFT_341294 [Lindgomyces ingoldianus]|uniref:Uncharacterized protein n=1 Tax=Lindgomyces ingoldianus TaxID=673940 RepID=A0ACB6R2S5_9PLEO|nr:uncharacterized protein BDR25DRAFT_341294 [Lindgomyces ingoldianus]KAF2473123.1 hypothetical protein BDR25DRAFT_341294 [Lindgomyces ingoldianus]
MGNQVPNLPVELISRILENVSSKTTLKNATLCSRQWYDIAIPHLYCQIDVGEGHQDEGVVRSLTILFLRNAKLAAHVRHFSIRPAFDDGPVEQKTPEDSVEAILAQKADLEDEIKAAVKVASQSDEEHAKWLELMGTEDEDCLLALLLPRFTNLETLDLEIPISPNYIDRMLWRVGRGEQPFDNEPTFARLNSIAWFHIDSKYGGSLPAGCFTLPSARAIYLHRMGSSDGDDPDKKLSQIEHGTSGCTHLEMHDCRLNDPDIKNIITVPKKLSTFIYEIGWGHLSYCSVNFQPLRDALEAHQSCLEDLWLDYSHDGIEWLDDMDGVSSMASFKHFSNLKRLRIAPDFIFGGNLSLEEQGEESRQKLLLEFLPLNVETLHITHGDQYEEMLYKALEHLLTNKESCLPDLRKLTFETSLAKVEKDRGDRLAAILQLAEKVGLPVTLLNNWGDAKYSNYDSRVERKWGMDEDIEWKPCGSYCNERPVYEIIDLQH